MFQGHTGPKGEKGFKGAKGETVRICVRGVLTRALHQV